MQVSSRPDPNTQLHCWNKNVQICKPVLLCAPHKQIFSSRLILDCQDLLQQLQNLHFQGTFICVFQTTPTFSMLQLNIPQNSVVELESNSFLPLQCPAQPVDQP